MSSRNFKRPLLVTLVVTAGLLAVARPASANIVYNGHAGLGSASLKFDSNEWTEEAFFLDTGTTERLDFMDYTDDAAVDKDLNQPDMGIGEQPTQINAPHGLSIGSSEVFELNTIRSNGDGNDLNVAGPAPVSIWAPGDGSDF